MLVGIGEVFWVGLGVRIIVGVDDGNSEGLGSGFITLLKTSGSFDSGLKAIMLAGKAVTKNPKTKYFQSPFINHKDYNSFDLEYFVNQVK